MNPGGFTPPTKELTFMSGANDLILTGTASERPDILLIIAPGEGRTLLRIGPDGELEGAVSDMSEAGRMFAECVADNLALMGYLPPRRPLT